MESFGKCLNQLALLALQVKQAAQRTNLSAMSAVQADTVPVMVRALAPIAMPGA